MPRGGGTVKVTQVVVDTNGSELSSNVVDWTPSGTVNSTTVPSVSGATYKRATFVVDGQSLPITNLTADTDGTVHVNKTSTVDLTYSLNGSDDSHQNDGNHIKLYYEKTAVLDRKVTYAFPLGNNGITITGDNLTQNTDGTYSQVMGASGDFFTVTGPRNNVYSILGSDYDKSAANAKTNAQTGLYESSSVTLQLVQDFSTETQTIQQWSVTPKATSATVNVRQKAGTTFGTTWRPSVGQSDVPDWKTFRPPVPSGDRYPAGFSYHLPSEPGGGPMKDLVYGNDLNVYFDLWSQKWWDAKKDIAQFDYISFIRINDEQFMVPTTAIDPVTTPLTNESYNQLRKDILAKMGTKTYTPTVGPNAGSTITIKAVDVRNGLDTASTNADMNNPGFKDGTLATESDTNYYYMRANNWSFRLQVSITKAKPAVFDIFDNDYPAISFDTAVEHSSAALMKNIGSKGIETEGHLNFGDDPESWDSWANHDTDPVTNAFSVKAEWATHPWTIYNTIGNPWGMISYTPSGWGAEKRFGVVNAGDPRTMSMRFKVRNGYTNPVLTNGTLGTANTANFTKDNGYYTYDLPVPTAPVRTTLPGSTGVIYTPGFVHPVQIVATAVSVPVNLYSAPKGTESNTSTPMTAVNVEKNRSIKLPATEPTSPTNPDAAFSGYIITDQNGNLLSSNKFQAGETVDATAFGKITDSYGVQKITAYNVYPTFADVEGGQTYKVQRSYNEAPGTTTPATEEASTFKALPGMKATYIGTPDATRDYNSNSYQYVASKSTLSADLTADNTNSAVLNLFYVKINKPTINPADIAKTETPRPANLSDDDKAAVKEAVLNSSSDLKSLVDDGYADVTVDDQGNISVKYLGDTEATPVATGKDTVTPDLTAPKLEPAADPSHLTDTEKQAVIDAIKAANEQPKGTSFDGAEFTVAADGTTTVTFPNGTTQTFTRDQTVKPSDASLEVNPRFILTPPVDGDLTDAQKAAVKDAFLKDNSYLPKGTTVEVADNGDVTVTYPDGSSATVPADKVFVSPPKKPLVVTDRDKLTDKQKADLKDAIAAANPGVDPNNIEVQPNGDVKITDGAGNVVSTIPSNYNVVELPELTPVADPANLTDAEKDAIKTAIEAANPGATVTVKDDGSATVTLPSGVSVDLTEKQTMKPVPFNRPAPVLVEDAQNLTDEEKLKVAEAVLAANPALAELGYTAEELASQISNNGNLELTNPDGKPVVTMKALAAALPARTRVENPQDPTEDEQALILERAKAANPDRTDENGDWEIKDGKVTWTPNDPESGEESLELPLTDVVAAYPEPTKVKDPENLTENEQKAVAQAIIDAQVEKGLMTDPDAAPTCATDPATGTATCTAGGVTITVDKDGRATAHWPAKGSGEDTFVDFGPLQTVQLKELASPDSAFAVADPNNLSDAEKTALADAVRTKNNIPPSIPITVDPDGTVHVNYPHGDVLTIKPEIVALPTPVVLEKLPDANNPLTEQQVKAIKFAILAKNQGLTAGHITVDPTTGQATVIKNGKPVVLTPSQTVVQQPALTTVADYSAPIPDASKPAIEEAVKAVVPAGSTVAWTEDTLTATYPDGQKVIFAKDQLVKPADLAAPAVKTPVVDPAHLTDAEKQAVINQLKETNPLPENATVEVADDGTVTVTYADGSTDTVPGTDTVLVVPPLTPVADPAKLTDAEKQAVADAVKNANSELLPEGATVEVADNGVATVKDKDGKTIATFPATQTVAKLPALTPVDPVKGLQPEDLPKIADAIKAANPDLAKDGATVTVKPDGSATATYPDGRTVSFSKNQTWKPSGLVEPTRVPVVDPTNLTEDEVAAVQQAVKDANKLPDSATVVTDPKTGVTTVTYVDGSTQTINPNQSLLKLPAITPVRNTTALTSDEVKAVEAAVREANKDLLPEGATITVDPATGAVTIKDRDKTLGSFTGEQTVIAAPKVEPVANPDQLTEDEQKAVAKNVADVQNSVLGEPTESTVDENGNLVQKYEDGTTISVKPNGETVVTRPNGTTATYPQDLTVRPAAIADPLRTPVVDPAQLTDAEKAAVAQAVKDANPQLPENAKVEVGDNGTVTITYVDGTTSVLEPAKTVVAVPALTPVLNPAQLTDAEKAAVAKAVEDANKSLLPEGASVEVADDGVVTIKDAAGNPIGTIPAAQTVSKIPALTPVDPVKGVQPEDLDKIKQAIIAANPDLGKEGATVTVNPDGSATATYPDGRTTSFGQDQTTKPSGLVNPALTAVAPEVDKRDPGWKETVAAKVKEANPAIPTSATVDVADDGTVTVTYIDGSTQVLKPADTIVKLPNITPVKENGALTDAEKQAVVKAIQDANPGVFTADQIKVADDGSVTIVDKSGQNTLAQLAPAQTVTGTPMLTKVGDTSKLTADEQKAVAEAVAKLQNPALVAKGEPTTDKDGNLVQAYEDGSTITVKPNGETVVTSPNGVTTTYPGANTVRPAALNAPVLTPVIDQANLTDEEKQAVVDAVRAANPQLSDNVKIAVNANGDTILTFADGSQETISAPKTVLEIPVLSPVADPKNLTDEEKQAVVDAVKKANPQLADVTVEVGADGAVTIKDPATGATLGTLNAEQTVAPVPALTPVAVVGMPTEKEREAIRDAVAQALGVSPDAVTVAEDGSVTVLFPDGRRAAFAPQVTQAPLELVGLRPLMLVNDIDHLTDAEKAAVAAKIREANPGIADNATVTVADDGTVTVTFVDGSTATIDRDDVVRMNTVNTPTKKIPVVSTSHLSDKEKEKVAQAVRDANPGLPEDATITVADDGTVTVTFRDGSSVTLKPFVEQLVKGENLTQKFIGWVGGLFGGNNNGDHAAAAGENAGKDGENAKDGKKEGLLAQTGAPGWTLPAAAALLTAGLVVLVVSRRRRSEES